MNRIFLSALVVFGLGLPGGAATLPLYQNSGTVFNPQIDATAVLNSGTLETSTSLPYDTANTLFYTNTLSGIMDGFPGFRLEFITDSVRLPAANVVNRGQILGSTHVLINANNITNSGTIAVGPSGLVRLSGKSINLSRGSVSAGSSANTSGSRGFIFPPFYSNPAGVTDLYWGGGTNNSFATGSGMFLNMFTLPFPRSPIHDVFLSGNPFTNRIQVPSGQLGNHTFKAWVFTNQLAGEQIIQVVFTPQDTDTNLVTTVKFNNSFGLESTAIVEFAVPDRDITTGQTLTNYIYLLDSLAPQGTNGVDLYTNIASTFVADLLRPAAYEISLSTPSEWLSASDPNTPFANALLFGPWQSNRVGDYYVAYSARIGQTLGFGTPGTPADPTNALGRVEINGDRVDLTSARIRAQGYLAVNATNLVGNIGAAFDTPFVDFNLATTNQTLTIDSFGAKSVRRLSGTLAAWSGIWTNRFLSATGAVFQFHALIVDHDLTATLPVTMGNVILKGTNLVIGDAVNAQLSFAIDAIGLTLTTNGSLSLPGDAGVAHLPHLKCLTNQGTILIQNTASFGNDTPQPLTNFLNTGNITAGSLTIYAATFADGGSLQTTAGPLTVVAGDATLTNDTVIAASDINLSAGTLVITNSSLRSAATLILSVTNNLTDHGSSNNWRVAGGFQLLHKPATGDLLGTTISSVAPAFAAVPHVCAATNRGVTTAGFSNNVAIGHLILDGTNGSLFEFTGAGQSNALYVDLLEFVNDATNYLAALSIDTNIVVYFADSNIPAEKLDGAFGGRLRWVKSYAGQNSSVPVTLPSGQTVNVNRALVMSPTIDSDADGIPNGFDPSPFDGVMLTVTMMPGPPVTSLLSWTAAAETVYKVEFVSTLGSTNWQFLRFVTNAASVGTVVTIQDVLPAGVTERYYRVCYLPSGTFAGLGFGRTGLDLIARLASDPARRAADFGAGLVYSRVAPAAPRRQAFQHPATVRGRPLALASSGPDSQRASAAAASARR